MCVSAPPCLRPCTSKPATNPYKLHMMNVRVNPVLGAPRKKGIVKKVAAVHEALEVKARDDDDDDDDEESTSMPFISTKFSTCVRA